MKSKKINRINKKKYKTFKKKGGNPDETTNGNKKNSARTTNRLPPPSNPFGLHSPFNEALLRARNRTQGNASPPKGGISRSRRGAFRSATPTTSTNKVDLLQLVTDRFKVFVWDFDDTIASKKKAMEYSEKNGRILRFTDKAHLSMDPVLLASLKSNSSEHPTAVQNLFFEPKEFVDVTSHLIEQGCKVYIASFGLIDNIVAILGMLYRSYGTISPFNRENANVYGLNELTTDEKVKWRSNKIPFLKDIQDENPGQDILFFDDDQENIDAQPDDLNIYGIKLGGKKSKFQSNSMGHTGFHINILGKIANYVENSGELEKSVLKDIAKPIL
jgi:hypothetical protein